jgi:outer membrane biosynthesis protein TonB
MRTSFLISIGFHLLIFVFVMFGLPFTSPSLVLDQRVINAQVISETQAPKSVPPPTPKKAEKTPPPASPKKAVALPLSKPKPAPPLDPPKRVKVKKPKPKPKPDPKMAEKPKKVARKFAPRPKARPKPNFERMMLRTVEKLDDRSLTKPEKKNFDKKMAALIKRQSNPTPQKMQRAPIGEKLTISEIDAIKQQIERCWLVPAAIGAKDVEKMVVQIRIKLNPDGRLRESRITDRFRLETNATYKAVAESALRAIRNPRCSKFNLPLAKYEIWRDIVLQFNPGEMVGR